MDARPTPLTDAVGISLALRKFSAARGYEQMSEHARQLERSNAELVEACKAALRLTQRYSRPTDDEGYRFSNEVTLLCLTALRNAGVNHE